MLKFSFLLLLATPALFVNVSNKWNSQKQAYYTPPKNYPILAEITPLDENGNQIATTYLGYIYPTAAPLVFYSFYSVLCRQEVKPVGAVNGLGQGQLNPWNGKTTSLSNKFKELSNVFKNGAAESQDKDILKEEVLTTPAEGLTEAATEYATEEISYEIATENVSEEVALQNIEDETNRNVQSNVFQCEGVTCPQETQSCKIVESAIAPSYEEITKTVFCLSSNEQTLLKDEKTRKNPNKGSSLNSSRSISRQINSAMQQKMKKIKKKARDDYKNSWKDFNDAMSNAFPPMNND